ncbi:hypothetical protein PR048_002052, partial [Dryococelus australis]
MMPEPVKRAPPGTAGHCMNPLPLLLVDNHKTHITLEAINFARESHIIMVGFPPHTIHRLQLVDVSFFGSLKTYYSQACDNFKVTHPGQAITDKMLPCDTLVFYEHVFLQQTTQIMFLLLTMPNVKILLLRLQHLEANTQKLLMNVLMNTRQSKMKNHDLQQLLFLL